MSTYNYCEERVKISSFKKERENVYSVWFESTEILKRFKPGQFVNVQVSENLIPVLRRPFAISCVKDGKFEMIFEIKGRGTKLFCASMEVGKEFNISGPLGNGFNLSGMNKKKLLIAGGLGIAPIKVLADYFSSKGDDVTVVWGNRDKADFFDMDYYLNKNMMFLIASDNGSVGFNGNVVDLISSESNGGSLDKLENYDIFAVGPTPMMRAVGKYLSRFNLSCQVSLEEPMACGLGVCQGCAVKKKDGTGFKLVCKDGPVFDYKEVEF